MTSTSPIETPALARTVRDVVAHQPDLVNEVWCRKILRHILQLLERQHALRLPHLPISPDTIGFDTQGEPMLQPAIMGSPEPGEAADVQALGAVIHYAITREPVPARSLRARGPEGYSESLVTAVDRCVAADPRERPLSIDELRNLLGIVALGPAVPVASAEPPAFMEVVAPPRAGIAALGKWQRWLMIGLAAVVLLATASAFFMLLRGTDAGDNVVLTLPQRVPNTEPPARTLDPNETLVTPATSPAAPGTTAALPPTTSAAPRTTVPAPDRVPAASRGNEVAATARGDVLPPAPVADNTAVHSQSPARGMVQARPVAPPPGRRANDEAAAEPTPAPVSGSASVKLLIKPWGTVYVDGVERGVSPPLKRLALPAGRHTVRVVNPNFRDRVIRIDASKAGANRINVDFAASSR
jgi:hypothetical protein